MVRSTWLVATTSLELLIELVRGVRDRAGHLVFDAQQLRYGDVVVPGVEAGGELALFVDPAPADAGQLRAAGGAEHVLAVLVLHDHLVGVVAVTVQENVDAVGVGENVGIGPGAALLLVAHVAHHDHIIGALGAGVVHRGLHRVVDALAALVLHEAVDELAVFILEIARGGGGQRLRCGHADEADLLPGQLPDHIGLEHQLALLLKLQLM